MNKKYLTVEEAAEYLCMTKKALYNKLFRRELPYYKLGHKKVLLCTEELDTFLRESRVEPRAKGER